MLVLFHSKVAIKEGFLLKQTWSFQRWRRRYFRLKHNKLYYAKDSKVSRTLINYISLMMYILRIKFGTLL